MDEDKSLLPAVPNGVVNLPHSSYRILDSDEEVFMLYTILATEKPADGTTAFRGLGHIDSHEDVLTIPLKIKASEDQADITPVPTTQRSRRSLKKKTRKLGPQEQLLEVEIVQDKTALRSRKGDTGSVVWHASVDFAELVLQHVHSNNPSAFLVRDRMSTFHILELGAGTGMLAVVLSPFVRHYTVTDIVDIIPLIQKNISRNLDHPSTFPPKSKASPSQARSNVTAMALDWLELRDATAAIRSKLVPVEPADLVLVVDCIYHPSLLPALLTTIDYVTQPGRTVVIVAVELRADDVVREFLQGWLDMAGEGTWEIWSVSELLNGPYAMWVGWKTAKDT